MTLGDEFSGDFVMVGLVKENFKENCRFPFPQKVNLSAGTTIEINPLPLSETVVKLSSNVNDATVMVGSNPINDFAFDGESSPFIYSVYCVKPGTPVQISMKKDGCTEHEPRTITLDAGKVTDLSSKPFNFGFLTRMCG